MEGANFTEADLTESYLDDAIVHEIWLERIVTNRVLGRDKICETYTIENKDGKFILSKRKNPVPRLDI